MNVTNSKANNIRRKIFILFLLDNTVLFPLLGYYMEERMPDSAFNAPPFLSSGWCGAWSVPMRSILPSVTALRSAARSSLLFIAGLHLILVPNVAQSASQNVRCAGVTSAVIFFSVALPVVNSSNSLAVLMCITCRRVPNFLASSTALVVLLQHASSLRITG